MKCVVSYNQMTIESDITVKAFNRASAYKPGSTTLRDDKGKLLFTAFLQGDTASGSLNNNGIIFNGATDEDKLFCSICLGGADVPADKKKAGIAEAYGPALAKLKELEAQIAEVNIGMDGVIGSVEDAITIA